MAKRRARIEELSKDYSRKIDQDWCFDEECRRIRMSRIESKPFSYALEALNSHKNSHTKVRLCFSEIRKKLKSRTMFGEDCIHHGVDAMSPSTNNVGLKPEIGGWESDARRKKIDVSDKDGVLAANRDVCERLIMGKSVGMIISEFWPRRDTHCCSASQRLRKSESSFSLSTDEEAQDEMKIVETNDGLQSKSPNDDNSTLDSVSDNDFASTPPSIHGFNIPESSKSQEEHESPVSVLDQFLAQDHFHKSSIIIFQNDRGPLKARRLCFEECSPESSKQDYNISQYVHLVLKAASLNWEQISTIRPLSKAVLHSSLYDEVEHLFLDPHFDTRLLFDRVNEVLLQIQRSPATERRKTNHRLALEEAVVDEIQRETEFYQTNERTLDQIVAKDVLDRRLWFDLVLESEHDIIIHIAQLILEESIVDVMFNIHC